MTSNPYTNVGRVLFSIPLIMFGLMHMMNADSMAAMMLEGWPLANVLVYMSGMGLILAGAALILKKSVRLAMQLLALLLIFIILGVHLRGMMTAGENEQLFATSMAGFLKDLGLLGGAFILAGSHPKE